MTIAGTAHPGSSDSAVVANLFLLLGIQRLSSNHREGFWSEVASPSVTGPWIAQRLHIGDPKDYRFRFDTRKPMSTRCALGF